MPGEPVAGAALHPGLVGASRRPRAPLHPEQGCGAAAAGTDALTSASPCKAGAGAHTPGTAGGPRHLHHRHRPKAHRARRAVERQPLPRDLQPLLLQVPRCPATPTPRGEPGVGTPCLPNGLGHATGTPPGGGSFGVGEGIKKCPREDAVALGDRHQHPLSLQLPAPHPPCPGYLLPGERCRVPIPPTGPSPRLAAPDPAAQTLPGAGGLGRTLRGQRVHGVWADADGRSGQGCPCWSGGRGAAPSPGAGCSGAVGLVARLSPAPVEGATRVRFDFPLPLST